MSLSELAIERYSRQLILPGWSAAMQMRLAARSVAVSTEFPVCALYLAAAGIGSIVLVGDPNPELELEIAQQNPLVRVDRIRGDTPAPQVDCALGLPDYAQAEAHVTISAQGIQFSDPKRVQIFGAPSGSKVFAGSAAAAAVLLAWQSEIGT